MNKITQRCSPKVLIARQSPFGLCLGFHTACLFSVGLCSVLKMKCLCITKAEIATLYERSGPDDQEHAKVLAMFHSCKIKKS